MAEHELEPLKKQNSNDEKKEKEPELKLKAEMTLLNGCTVIVGCIIGSGIFISPTGVLQSTGSVNMSLVVWTISGIFTMLGAYCYAELGCMIKKSGADYAYIFTALGPFPAFIRLWIECIIVRPCSAAIQALTFSLYILKPLFPECEPPDEVSRLLAALCICFLCYINCKDVKWANLVQDYFTYAKVFALIIIIITGFVQLGKGRTEQFTWEGTETDPTLIALSFYSGLFAYSGWNYLNFIIEEMKDPVRDLPRAIAISCVVCLVIYVLTIIAFHTTLTTTEVLGSEAVAVTFANRLYGSMAWIIPIFVACSTFGATERTTPVPSVLTITVLSLLYLTSSNISVLMNYLGFATWLSIGAAVFCLPYLRWKAPNLARPIKVNLIFPIVYLVLTVAITVLPMIAKPVETAIGLGMILTAVPVYIVFIAWTNKPKFVAKMTDFCTIQIQKLFIVLPADKGD